MATIEDYTDITADTILLYDPETRPPIKDIAQIFRARSQGWIFRELDNLGHMAPLTHPGVVNPLIAGFFDNM